MSFNINEYVLPHFRDENRWKPIPPEEIIRLVYTLRSHLREINIKMTPDERESHVRRLLTRQNRTCAWGKYTNGRHCWNRPRDNTKDGEYAEVSYLKLQWSHIIPKAHCEKKPTLDSLYLLCERCNNQLQTGRSLPQLMVELQTKLNHIIMLIANTPTEPTPSPTAVLDPLPA